VKNNEDLMRFCFKSESCKLTIPEMEFETGYGDGKGVYTTIEGILSSIREKM